MGHKKWSEIKALGKATALDREEARAELAEELRIALVAGEIESSEDEVARRFEESSSSEGREVPVAEYLTCRQKLRDSSDRDRLE